MAKKKKAISNSRDAPAQSSQTAWLCSPKAFEVLLGDGGFTPLANNPEVRMCVHRIAELVSSMPLHLMQNTEKGDIRIKNALSSKLDISPHKRMTRKNWMYNIINSMLLPGEGNQVTFPRYTNTGLLDNLEPWEASKVTFQPNGEQDYLINYKGKNYDPDEVLHFVVNPNPDKPWIGTGYRAILRDVVKGLRQAGATKQKLMESPSPSIIVKVDGLTEEFASAEGRRKLRSQYLDSSEAGEPWFIPAEAMSIESVKPMTLNDLAIAKNMELDKQTIAGIFGVPPFMVGVGTYNRDAYDNFIATVIFPIARNIEQELTRKILIASDLFWRFNQNSLYGYSLKEKVEAGKEMVDRNSLARNEWRSWIGFAPRDDMEELVMLENYIPAAKIGSQSKLNGGDE